MTVRFVVIICLIGIAIVSMAAPVAAATAGASASSGTGGVAAYVSISLNQTSLYMPLVAATTVTNVTGATVTSNAMGGYTVTVSDSSTGRGSTSPPLGYMGNYTSGAYVPGTAGSMLNTTLGSPLGLAATSNTSYPETVNSITSVGTSSPTIFSSTVKTPVPVLVPITLSQTVSAIDPVLPTSNVYRIDLTFTISAN